MGSYITLQFGNRVIFNMLLYIIIKLISLRFYIEILFIFLITNNITKNY